MKKIIFLISIFWSTVLLSYGQLGNYTQNFNAPGTPADWTVTPGASSLNHWTNTGGFGYSGAFGVYGESDNAQSETLTFEIPFLSHPTYGADYLLSFLWQNEISINKNSGTGSYTNPNADITVLIQTSADGGTTWTTASTIWSDNDKTILQSTTKQKDGSNLAYFSFDDYQDGTNGYSDASYYKTEIDITSYFNVATVNRIRVIYKYVGQFGGDFAIDNFAITETLNPSFKVELALSTPYTQIPVEQVNASGYTVSVKVTNYGETGVFDNKLNIKIDGGDYLGASATWKSIDVKNTDFVGTSFPKTKTYTVPGFLPTDEDASGFEDFDIWAEGTIGDVNPTTLNQGNTEIDFNLDDEIYSRYANFSGTLIQEEITNGFGTVFYLEEADHFKGFSMTGSANSKKFYLLSVADENATTGTVIFESPTTTATSYNIPNADDYIKLAGAKYYMVFVTNYSGTLNVNYTETENDFRQANCTYYYGKPNSFTKVQGQRSIDLDMVLQANRAPVYAAAGGFTLPGSVKLGEGVKLNFNLLAEDADGDNASFSILDGTPSWVTVAEPTEGKAMVTVLPTTFEVGTHSFNVETTDGNAKANYNVTLEVIDGYTIDASNLKVSEQNGFSNLSWTILKDQNLDENTNNWTDPGTYAQIVDDKTKNQKEILISNSFMMPALTDDPTGKLYAYFGWYFENLSMTGASDLGEVKIEMFKEGGTLLAELWNDDNEAVIMANTVKNHSHLSDFENQALISEWPYDAAQWYTSRFDITSLAKGNRVYFVITYEKPVTVSDASDFRFNDFQIEYKPSELDLYLENNKSVYVDNHYTQIPLYQAMDLTVSVDIYNKSSVDSTSNNLVVSIDNSDPEEVFYETIKYNVTGFDTTTVALVTKFTPEETGTHTMYADVKDKSGANTSVTTTLNITADELATDDNDRNDWAYQNDKYNGLANKFIIKKKDYLKKIKVYMFNYNAITFTLVKEGTPNQLIWTSEEITDFGGGWYTYNLNEDYQTLDPGTYYLLINELAEEYPDGNSLYVAVDDNSLGGGKFYRGDVQTIVEAKDYDNTDYPDFRGDLMLRMVLNNDAPDVVAIANQKAIENNLFSLKVGASDVEGNPITMTVYNKPNWLSFNAANFTFSGTPTGNDAGEHYVELYAKDGRDSTRVQFRITVEKDPLPFFTTNPVVQLVQGQTYNYTAKASDLFEQNVTISLESALPAGLTGTGTAGKEASFAISGTLAVGQHFIQLRATDSNGGFVVQSFIVNVLSNSAPYFVSEGVTFNWAGDLYELSILAKDANQSDVLTITAPTLPTWLTLSATGNGEAKLSGTPAEANAGTNAVILYVTDNFGATDSLVFSIEVVARAVPVITGNATESGTVGQVFSINVSVSDANASDEVILYVTEKPSWLSFNNAGENNYTLHGTPTSAGNYKVVMLASDGYLTSAEFTVAITISENPNTAPTISSSPVTTATTGADYAYTITATDADGDYLYFIGSEIPSWLNIQDNLDGTAILFGHAEEGNLGYHEVTVGVTDGNNTTKQSFVIEVIPGNKKLGEINVYPNPAVDKLIVDNAEKSNIRIYNLAGQMVKEVYNAETIQTIDMSDCALGVYIMHITTTEQTLTKKINIVK